MSNEVTVTSTDVQRRLGAVLELTQNNRRIMRGIGGIIEDQTHENFETHGGGEWPALKHRDGEPLRDKGHLFSSLVPRVTNTSVEYGTNLIYARLHQYGAPQGAFGKTKRGAPIPWGDVPARKYLPMSESGEIDQPVLNEIMLYLTEQYQRALN